MSITRRGFLKGLGALAATAVVSPSILVPLGKTDLQRFMEMASSGVIRGQTFMFDGPVVLSDIPHRIEIINSTFLWSESKRIDGSALTIAGCMLSISNSSFSANADTVIHITDGTSLSAYGGKAFAYPWSNA